MTDTEWRTTNEMLTTLHFTTTQYFTTLLLLRFMEDVRYRVAYNQRDTPFHCTTLLLHNTLLYHFTHIHGRVVGDGLLPDTGSRLQRKDCGLSKGVVSSGRYE